MHFSNQNKRENEWQFIKRWTFTVNGNFAISIGNIHIKAPFLLVDNVSICTFLFYSLII